MYHGNSTKLSTNGDLKNDTQRKYPAYRRGTIKGILKTEVGAITDVSTGNETIGAFTDTRFNEAPSTGSITTYCRFISNRRNAEDGGDFRNAVYQEVQTRQIM